MPKRHAVIFDMDGVLVDTEPLYLESNRAIFARLGFDVPLDEYAQFVGTSAARMWTILKRKHALSEPVEALVRLESDEYYRRLARLEALPPIPGIEDLIGKLRSLPARLAVASSSSRAVVELTLEKSGLSGAFDVVVCGDEVAYGKPHPEIFLKAAEHLGTPPEACVVIEDSPRGIAGAKAAGMRAVGFQNPNSGNQDLSGAELLVHDFGEASNARIARLVAETSCGAADAVRVRTRSERRPGTS